MKHTKSLKIALDEPVVVAVVARGPVEERRWGFYQFPGIERLADGSLHVSYSKQLDSPTTYGIPRVHLLSYDNGSTWQEVTDADSLGSALLNKIARWPALNLPNGDRLRIMLMRSRKVEELKLPRPYGTWGEDFGSDSLVYSVGDLPEELRDGWHMARLKADSSNWDEEVPKVRMQGEIRWTSRGVFAFPTFRGMRLAPDGSIWGKAHTCLRIVDGKIPRHMHILLLRSVDNGYTFKLHGEIPYKPDKILDPEWKKNRWGFSEPDIGFAPDGSILCFIRSEGGGDRPQYSPLYLSRSTDNGVTWSNPEIFDTLGVSPELCKLDSGVMLVSYGRPGLYLRAAADPCYMEWGERITVVEAGESGCEPEKWNTCAYPFMIALDENAALICYSHFNYPDVKGVKRKTILVRKITVS
jgi:hypothetical protein